MDEDAARAFGQSVGDWPAFPDSAMALRHLKRHFELIILSNVDRASFARSNERLGVEFDRVFTAEEIGSYKPDLRQFRIFARAPGRDMGWRKATCCTSHRACFTIMRPQTGSASPRRGSTGGTTSPVAGQPRCRSRCRTSTSASPRWKNSPQRTAPSLPKPASTHPADAAIAAECTRPLRLTIDGAVPSHNWRWLAERAGVPAGAAIKADGYGLGARRGHDALDDAGCRDFFVSTWAEADELGQIPDGASLCRASRRRSGRSRSRARLHARGRCSTRSSRSRAGRKSAAGPPLRRDDRHRHEPARASAGRDPARSTASTIDTLHSHLACADEDHALERHAAASASAKSRRRCRPSATASPIPPASALAATIASTSSGPGWRSTAAFRGARPRAISARSPVSRREVVQRRTIRAGESCGYGATFVAEADTEAAIVNIGYADGYLRGFSSKGARLRRGICAAGARPGVDGPGRGGLRRGARTSRKATGSSSTMTCRPPSKQSGLSQYELLTSLGARFERRWA